MGKHNTFESLMMENYNAFDRCIHLSDFMKIFQFMLGNFFHDAGKDTHPKDWAVVSIGTSNSGNAYNGVNFVFYLLNKDGKEVRLEVPCYNHEYMGD